MDNLENFDNIELTEEETLKILREATEQKRAKLRLAAHWERVNNPPPIPKLTAEEFKSWSIKSWEKKTGLHWIETTENKKIVDMLSRYFVDDETIEHEGYSLQKGIMLIGGVGVGKTTIMQLFAYNPKGSFQIISCRNIANDFTKYGTEVIDNHSQLRKVSDQNPFRHELLGTCYDDLGTETKRKNYGNESNVMEEIILGRYDKRHTIGAKTHITTNLAADQIAEGYGDRVRSRLREMMNVFIFEGQTDMRK